MTLSVSNNETYISYSIEELKCKGIDIKNILVSGKIEELAKVLIEDYSNDSYIKYKYEHADLLNGKLICKVSELDELSKQINDARVLETAIKVYNINQDNDFALYMVFKTLMSESVFVPVNKEGNLLSLSMDDEKEVISLFTARNRIDISENIHLSEIYLTNYIELLLKVKKHLVINPFSEKTIQFMIPYEAIEKFLIPLFRGS